jgi:hypothetical protein
MQRLTEFLLGYRGCSPRHFEKCCEQMKDEIIRGCVNGDMCYSSSIRQQRGCYELIMATAVRKCQFSIHATRDV